MDGKNKMGRMEEEKERNINKEKWKQNEKVGKGHLGNTVACRTTITEI